jgi:ribosome-associated protein
LQSSLNPDNSGSVSDKKTRLIQLQEVILTSLDEDKAEDVLCIDLEGKSSIADKMVIASGRSARHVAALADHVSKKVKENGFGNVKIQGLPNADWVLIDAGDIITHIFKPEVRAFYDIERIWADGQTLLGKA